MSDYSGYKQQMTDEEKENTIKEFLPYIKYTAYRLSNRLPRQLTIDDLVSVGIMGLLDAMGNYEAGRGAKLKTYAEFRIKGAMLDELRAFDPLPRALKEKVNEIKKIYVQLESSLGRVPEDEEVAGALNISLQEYFKILQSADGAIVLRFEDFGQNMQEGDNINILESIPDKSAKDPLKQLEETSMKETLAKLIDELPDKEKLILSLYYWEEMTMKEIGKVMNITEGRVCQLHSQATLRLKGKLTEVERETFNR